MLNNIELSEINKNQVMVSTFIIPLAAPLFLFSAGFMNNGALDEGFGLIMGYLLISLLYGAIFWLPTILGVLVLEFLIINERSNALTVKLLMFFEGLLAFAIIWGVFGFESQLNTHLPIALLICIGIPQLLRWWYLKSKNRLFNSAKNESNH